MDHACARPEAKLAKPRTPPESAHRGIDNGVEFQNMIIFTLHATTTALRDMSTRAQQTVEHREIGRKPRARRDQYTLHEQAIHAARLRDATAARSGWHSNGKPHGGGECSHAPRRKESSRPWPKEAAANGFARARPSVLRACCARCRRASCSATWRASLPCWSGSPSCSA